MAARADDPERIQLALRSIAAMLEELPNLAHDWPTISRDEQIAWSLEWGNEMSKLRRLAEASDAGRLDRLHDRQFRALAERTVRSIALVERLDLRRPDATVLAAGQARAST